jgi:hypothetical protein
VNADPDVQVWENPDERTLRDSWDDPEESSNI